MKYESVIDLGSSKVATLIGERGSGGAVNVRGISTAAHPGIRTIDDVDVVGLRAAVLESLDMTQEKAGVDVATLTMAVPGLYSKTLTGYASLTFDEPQLIQDEDIERMSIGSLESLAMSGLVLLHSIPVYFVVDGQKTFDFPESKSVSRVEAEFSHIFMRQEFVELTEKILQGSSYSVERYVDSIFAESLAVIPDKALEEEAVLVDVGGYQTDVCAMHSHAPVFRRRIPVGGMHLRNDLCYVLKVEEDAAESLKRHYVFGLDYDGSNETCRMQDGSLGTVDNAVVQEILEARSEEIALLVGGVLEDGDESISEKAPIYVTGGGLAPIRGCESFLQKFFDRPLKVALPRNHVNNQYFYTSTYAVLDYVMGQLGASKKPEKKPNSFLQRLLHFFTE